MDTRQGFANGTAEVYIQRDLNYKKEEYMYSVVNAVIHLYKQELCFLSRPKISPRQFSGLLVMWEDGRVPDMIYKASECAVKDRLSEKELELFCLYGSGVSLEILANDFKMTPYRTARVLEGIYKTLCLHGIESFVSGTYKEIYKLPYPLAIIQDAFKLTDAEWKRLLFLYEEKPYEINLAVEYMMRRKLSPKQYQIVMQRYKEGLSYEKLSEMFLSSREGARVRIKYALKELGEDPEEQILAMHGITEYMQQMFRKHYEDGRKEGKDESVAEFQHLIVREGVTLNDVKVFAFGTANPYLMMSFEDFAERFQLSFRTYNQIRRAGVKSVKELTGISETTFMKTRGVGNKAIAEIKEVLEKAGLSLAKEET